MRVLLLAGVALLAGTANGHAGVTLDTIRAKGYIQCGVSTGVAGFSLADSQGNWTGLDVDVCHAIAAAVFGDAGAVRFTPLNAQVRFTALQSGDIDILSRNTTESLTRDTTLGLAFVGVTFYDGQGFMVPAALGVTSVNALENATVCVQPGTTTERNMTDYFRSHDMSFEPVVIEKLDEAVAAFFGGRCDALTTDASALAAIRSTRAPNPADYVVLPEIISKEPLAVAVREGDDDWEDIARWVIVALKQAEESGITSANIDTFKDSQDPTVQRLLGTVPGMGEALGLPEDWAYQAIRQVGNYGEIFERNVGHATPLGLDRGLNALWSAGGLMYPPPIQ